MLHDSILDISTDIIQIYREGMAMLLAIKRGQQQKKPRRPPMAAVTNISVPKTLPSMTFARRAPSNDSPVLKRQKDFIEKSY